MARNVVENGTVGDHVRALQLFGVLLRETGDRRVVLVLPGDPLVYAAAILALIRVIWKVKVFTANSKNALNRARLVG